MEKALCEYCGGLFEEGRGLSVHQSHCGMERNGPFGDSLKRAKLAAKLKRKETLRSEFLYLYLVFKLNE